MESGVRGHVELQDDEVHGRLGVTPSDFEGPEESRSLARSKAVDRSQAEREYRSGIIGRLRNLIN
jgi:hypothetical protein